MNSIGAGTSLGNAFSSFLEPQYTRKTEAKLLLQMIKKSIHRGAGIPGHPGDNSTTKTMMNLRSSNHHYRHYHPNNNKSGLFVSPLAMKEKMKESLTMNSAHSTRPFSTIIHNYTNLTRKRQTNNTNATSSLNILVNKKSSINRSSLPPLHSATGNSLQKISKSRKAIIIGSDENPQETTSRMKMAKKKLEKQSSYPKLASKVFQNEDNKKHPKDTKLFRALNFHKKMSKVKTDHKTLKESSAAPEIGTMSSSILKSTSNNAEKNPSQYSSSQYPISTSHSRDQEFRSLYGRLKVHYILQDETVKNLSIPEKLTRIIKNLELFEKELVDYLVHPNAMPQAKVVLKDLRSRRAEMQRKLAEYSIQSMKSKSMKETPFPNIEASVPFNSRQQINADDNVIIDKKQKIAIDSPSTPANNQQQQPKQAVRLQADSKAGLIKEKAQQPSKLPRIKLNQSSKKDTISSVTLSNETLSRKKGYRKYLKKTGRKSSIKMMAQTAATRQDDSVSQASPGQQEEQIQQPNHIINGMAVSTAISKPTSESKMKKRDGGGFSSFLPVKWKKSEFIKLLPHSGDIQKNTSKVISENPMKTSANTKGTRSNINSKFTKMPSIPNPNDVNLQSWALPEPPNYKNYMSWLEEMMANKLAEDVKNRKEEEPENDSNKTVTKSNNSNQNHTKQNSQEQPPKWSKVPENPNATKQKHNTFIKEFTSRLTPKFKAELEELKPHLNHNSQDNSTTLNKGTLDNSKYISPLTSINHLSLGRHQTFPAPAVLNPFPEMSFTFHPRHNSPFVGTNPVAFQAVSNSIKSVVENSIGHQNLNMNPVPQLNYHNNHINSKNTTSIHNSNYEQPKSGTRNAKTASDPQSLGLHLPKFVHPKTATGVGPVSRNLTATNNDNIMNTTTNSLHHSTIVNRNQVNTLFSLKNMNPLVHSQNQNHLREESKEEIPQGKSVVVNPSKYSQPRNLIPTMTPIPTSQLQPPLSAPCSFGENIEKDVENINIQQVKSKTAKTDEEKNKSGREENNQRTTTLQNSLQSFVGTSNYLQPRNYYQVTTHDTASLKSEEKWNLDYKHNYYSQNQQNFKTMPLPFNATLAVPISHINAKLQPSLNQSTRIAELNHGKGIPRQQFLDNTPT